MVEKERIEKLRSLLQSNIVVIDGAMGTSIQDLDLSEEDFGGQQYDGCNEYLNLINPDCIRGIHRTYIESGADIIETNSFHLMVSHLNYLTYYKVYLIYLQWKNQLDL